MRAGLCRNAGCIRTPAAGGRSTFRFFLAASAGADNTKTENVQARIATSGFSIDVLSALLGNVPVVPNSVQLC